MSIEHRLIEINELVYIYNFVEVEWLVETELNH